MKRAYVIVGLMLLECITYSDKTAVVRQLDNKTYTPISALTVKNPQRLRPDQIISATYGRIGKLHSPNHAITITV